MAFDLTRLSASEVFSAIGEGGGPTPFMDEKEDGVYASYVGVKAFPRPSRPEGYSDGLKEDYRAVYLFGFTSTFVPGPDSNEKAEPTSYYASFVAIRAELAKDGTLYAVADILPTSSF